MSKSFAAILAGGAAVLAWSADAAADDDADPTVTLHVEGPRDVEIVGRPNDGYGWTPICQAPCNRTAHLDWEYMARGQGMRSSAPFLLTGSDGQRVAVSVDPASTGWFVLGVIGAIGGGSIALTGLSIMGMGAALQSVPNDGTQQSANDRATGGNVVTVGGVVTAVGAFFLVGGGIAAISNWTTSVTPVDTKDALPRLPAPTWRSAEAQGMPAPAATYQWPLVTARF